MNKRYTASIWGIKCFKIIKTNSIRNVELIKLLSRIIPWKCVKIIDWDKKVNRVIYYKRRERA